MSAPRRTRRPPRPPVPSPAEAGTMGETDTLVRFLAAVPEALPHVRAFRRNIVNAAVSAGGRQFHAVAGVSGQADAYAIVAGGGHVEIETKAAKGVMREAQTAWREQMIRMRVPHLVLRIRTGEHVDATVERWIVELRDAVDCILADSGGAP